MKIINDFNDYQIDMIFENESRNSVSELPFVLSRELIKILKDINHPISNELLTLNKDREDSKFTLIDVDNDIYSKGEKEEIYNKRFTIVNSNKAYDNIIDYYGNIMTSKDKEHQLKTIKSYLMGYTMDDVKYDYPFITKNRIPIRIGSFIKKVFKDKFKDGGDPGNDIESFVNSIVAFRKSKSEKKSKREFKLVKGQDIVTYYNEESYDGNSGPLHGSCMRYDSCTNYIEFYAKNSDVSLLILTSDNDTDKIVGRALVWDLVKPSGRTFMDRIYTVSDDDVELFKMYAAEQGWLYKKRQNMDVDTEIVDPIDNTSNKMTLVTNHNIKRNDDYPYMDTLAYYNVEQYYLSNSKNLVEDETEEEYYILKGTDGDDYDVEEIENKIYVKYYGEKIDEDELTWCEHGDDWRKDGDYEELGSFYDYEKATNTFVDSKMVWSEYHDQYIMDDESIHSDYHDSEILQEESIEVMKDAHFDTLEEAIKFDDGSDDVRHVDEVDNSVIEYKKNNGYKNNSYYFDMEENDDIFVTCLIYGTSNVTPKHKIWDKNNIIKKDNQIYNNIKYLFVTDQKDKDKLLGQQRLFDGHKQIRLFDNGLNN